MTPEYSPSGIGSAGQKLIGDDIRLMPQPGADRPRTTRRATWIPKPADATASRSTYAFSANPRPH
ncbi:hypothetical protein [Actinoplanes sp. NPDC049599]|uniref:hypothetical protein n=1 Tax=Actinoplanes sp. NPDC049599 TaxID=3363903 RepID=UPI003789AA92